MVNPEILRQYAELAVRAGVHIQPEFPECVTITSGRNPVISMV